MLQVIKATDVRTVRGGAGIQGRAGVLYQDGDSGALYSWSEQAGVMVSVSGAPSTSVLLVNSSRALTNADDGMVLECTGTLTLTVPAGLRDGFGCSVIPFGTTSIASSGGALLNGATTALTRAASSNSLIAIIERASAVGSFVVSGS